MTGVPAIILAKGNVPEQAVIDKASEEGVCICSSDLDTFSLAGILYTLLQK
jgi:serine kinase of HPr protein (carbohydrate metabolism regulator)